MAAEGPRRPPLPSPNFPSFFAPKIFIYSRTRRPPGLICTRALIVLNLLMENLIKAMVSFWGEFNL